MSTAPRHLVAHPKDIDEAALLDISHNEQVSLQRNEPDFIRVDIALAERTHAPTRFLGAIAVSTNDTVDAQVRIQGNHSQHLAIVATSARGLDADCINAVLSTLCFEVPPGVALHDAPSPDLRIIWTDEAGGTETQRIPGACVHQASQATG